MKRNKLQEYMDSLDAIANGNNRVTQIMETASINGTFLKKMLYIATQRGEVVETKKGSYSIGEKGLEFLNEWKQYKEFSKRIDSFLSDKNEKK